MINRVVSPLLVTLSFIQGVILYFLYKSITNNAWPYTQPDLFLPLISIILIIPILIFLLYTSDKFKKIFIPLSGFSVLLIFVGYYSGYQLIPFSQLEQYAESVLFAYFLMIALVSFLLAVFVSVWQNNQPLKFENLSKVSLRFKVVLILSVTFSAIAYGLLALCAELFGLVGVDLFQDVFYESWFVIPFLTSTMGFFIGLLRSQNKITDSISSILILLSTYLLVLVSTISILFILVLPFAGFEKLWDSNFGAALMITLQCFVLILFNLVYSSSVQKLNIVFEWIIKIALAMLVFYSLLSLYAVVVRIDQYGLTVGRLYAISICVLLLALNAYYSFSILLKHKVWLNMLHKGNVWFAAALFVLAVLNTSPFLDFRKISVNSQLERVESNETDVLKLDGYYFKRHLARPGLLALNALEEQYKIEHPDLIELITVSRWSAQSVQAEVVIKNKMVVYSQLEIPDNDMQSIINHTKRSGLNQFIETNNYFLLAKDLNQDGDDEYMIFVHRPKSDEYSQELIVIILNHAKYGLQQLNEIFINDEYEIASILEDLKTQTMTMVPSQWSNLSIGGFEIEAHSN